MRAAGSGLRVMQYEAPGGREPMLRFGPADAPQVIVAPPLLEEANRTRATIVTMLHALAARWIGGVLPDLPGTGESLREIAEVTLPGWRAAFAAAAEQSGARHVVAFRAGALVDGEADVASRWYASPIEGAAFLREGRRVQAASNERDPLVFAGNRLSPSLVKALEAAEPMTRGPLRVARFEGDPRPANLVLPGVAPWRTAEPRRHDDLAALMVSDIAEWIETCGG